MPENTPTLPPGRANALSCGLSSTTNCQSGQAVALAATMRSPTPTTRRCRPGSRTGGVRAGSRRKARAPSSAATGLGTSMIGQPVGHGCIAAGKRQRRGHRGTGQQLPAAQPAAAAAGHGVRSSAAWRAARAAGRRPRPAPRSGIGRVDLDQGDGVAAGAVAAEVEGRDVDLRVAERSGRARRSGPAGPGCGHRACAGRACASIGMPRIETSRGSASWNSVPATARGPRSVTTSTVSRVW